MIRMSKYIAATPYKMYTSREKMLAWKPKSPAIKSYCRRPIESQLAQATIVSKNAINVIIRAPFILLFAKSEKTLIFYENLVYSIKIILNEYYIKEPF